MSSVQGYVDELVTWACSTLQGEEVLLASFAGEHTDFIRFNGGEVRQAGSVTQGSLTIDLIEGARHTEGSVVLANDVDMDRHRVTQLLGRLREQRALVPTDPYLLYNREPVSSESVHVSTLPDATEALASIRAGAAGRDLVGIYAAGDTFSGFASSLGQRNWHQASTFNLDWSFYLRADKAAKNLYAGTQWDDDAFAAKVEWSQRQLDVLDRTPIDLAPGDYRTYLAPVAMLELIDLWSWDGFGEKMHQTRQTPLLQMVSEGANLSPRVQLREATADGAAPNFQEAGYLRPDEVVLIDGGRYVDTLVSPRSAQEYGVETNGASESESPESLAMAPGGLVAAEALEALDTGLFVGNLWYTSFSDRAACRTTGMTRFATFWADGGELVAPVNVMRFDDTIYSLLGDKLVDLTTEAEVIPDSSSYGRRSVASFRLPGALVEAMTFTL